MSCISVLSVKCLFFSESYSTGSDYNLSGSSCTASSYCSAEKPSELGRSFPCLRVIKADVQAKLSTDLSKKFHRSKNDFRLVTCVGDLKFQIASDVQRAITRQQGRIHGQDA